MPPAFPLVYSLYCCDCFQGSGKTLAFGLPILEFILSNAVSLLLPKFVHLTVWIWYVLDLAYMHSDSGFLMCDNVSVNLSLWVSFFASGLWDFKHRKTLLGANFIGMHLAYINWLSKCTYDNKKAIVKCSMRQAQVWVWWDSEQMEGWCARGNPWNYVHLWCFKFFQQGGRKKMIKKMWRPCRENKNKQKICE